MTAGSLHVAVSGWLLGPQSGANRRLRAILDHADALLENGERITVLHRDTPERADTAAVRWQRVAIPAGPLPQRVLAERRELPSVLRRLDANLLDHGLLPVPPLPASLPICVTIHDLRAVDGLTRWPQFIARAAVRRAADRAAALVVPSEFTAARVRSVTENATIEVIGNGVDVPAAAPLEPPRDDRPAILLHVGHLEPRKNLDVLVRALALLPGNDRPRLVLVGRDAGAWTALRDRAVELGVGDAIEWRGVLPDPAVTALLRTAAAVVVPSRYEGFGLPALDGLAHGRPTLVADAGALPEVVSDAGVVLPPDDPAAWANAIRTAVAPETGNDVEARSRRIARATALSWRTTAERVVELWRRLVSARRS